LQNLFHQLDVLGPIHADRIVRRDQYLDRKAVLQRAQLLQLFSSFQFTLRQLHEFQQKLAAERINPQVLVEFREGQPLRRAGGLRIADVRNSAAGKVQRVAVPTDGDLYHVVVVEIGGGLQLARQRSHDARR